MSRVRDQRRRDTAANLARLGDVIADFGVFLPALTVPLVLILAGLFNDLILNRVPATDLGSSQDAFPFQFVEGLPPFEEFATRTEWAASALAFLLLGLGCAAIAAYTWIATLPAASKRPLRAFGVQLLAIVIGAFALHHFSPTFDSFVLQKPFLEPSVYALFPKAEGIGSAIDVMAAVVIVLVALAVCVSVKAVPRASSAKGDESERSGDVAVPIRTVRRIRLLLAVAAITMVAGVLQVGSLYRWGTTMLLSDPVPAAEVPTQASGEGAAGTSVPPYLPDQKRIPESVALAAGVVYSALLAGIFLPAFGVLRSRMRALAATHCPDGTENERGEWLAKRGLVATLPKQALSALAVLAPLLVGGPGSLLTRVLGGD